MEKKEKESYFYLITIAYDGSDFVGWAKQPQQFTVQGYIEKILNKIFKINQFTQQKINILAASRTDKGVHALNQKFTFRLPFFLSCQKLKRILVKSLQEYILVKSVRQVKKKFHPIKSVSKKEYRYYMNTGKYNLFAKKYCWEYNLLLDTKKLNNILTIFQGKHDFFNFSFCRQKDQDKTVTIRTIEKIRCWKREELLIISINARGFLRYQIRAMIGESIKCYEGKQTIKKLQEKLNYPQKKSLKYQTLAPASGLYLYKITYGKVKNFLIEKNV
ncbi:tRNA pseudouridine(38-40) synthase TruA [endosymbiont GvMRE of Glomus versiforme]|uniref:tRNA pseudouridine(38-40) synthase TruA n=1 Tax=endosymbiont GvMRE of Glomus versiforme TaxID=2039283 RepID=UPI000ED6DF1D|nr:tRNA pseudouridine(38-40) synthase TruA [endosymbiont GvMRE of Glomus versiforme]RHZ37014.1 tRNA pseudouridine synthase A [endosymbiont GvMRE of Glomus versiforme]